MYPSSCYRLELSFCSMFHLVPFFFQFFSDLRSFYFRGEKEGDVTCRRMKIFVI